MTLNHERKQVSPVIAVTGASGFIGRQVVAALNRANVDLVEISRTQPGSVSGRHTIRANLLEAQGREYACSVRAEILIHLAWDVSPGFWTAESNEQWLSASYDLVRRFWEKGGKKVVLAGTCAEYAFDKAKTTPLSEARSPFVPSTRYGQAKLALRQKLEKLRDGQDDVELSSGLIFFPFGPGELVNRLVPTVIRACLAGETPKLTSGCQLRDFIDSWTTGQAFADLALSDVQGPVNIGSGRSQALRNFVSTIKDRINPALPLEFGAIPDRADEPPCLVADVGRLVNEVGHRRIQSEHDAIDDTIAYWRALS